MITVAFPCSRLISSRNQKFLWRERTEQSANIVKRALCNLECTGRNIQKGRSAFILIVGQSGNIIVLLLFEQLIVEGHSRSYKFSDSSLDHPFCEFRIFKLVTDRHLIAGTYKSWKICLERMMREAGHRNSTRSRTRTLCKHDAQHLAGSQGIISICLIKITAPEQKHCFRMLRLHSEELSHHRSLGRFLFCHKIFSRLIVSRFPSMVHPDMELSPILAQSPRLSTHRVKPDKFTKFIHSPQKMFAVQTSSPLTRNTKPEQHETQSIDSQHFPNIKVHRATHPIFHIMLTFNRLHFRAKHKKDKNLKIYFFF